MKIQRTNTSETSPLPEVFPSRPNLANNHQTAVNLEGFEDLFQWAKDTVPSGDNQDQQAREQRIRKQVLEVIQNNQEYQAQVKYADELNYLQRRLIALLQVLQEKLAENTTLKQVMVSQYFHLQRIPQLEQEVKQLKALTWYRQEAEAERKHLLNALSKLKKENDFLDELLVANESENARLIQLLAVTRLELKQCQDKWWQKLAAFFTRASRFSA